jgi:hypothetical protein
MIPSVKVTQWLEEVKNVKGCMSEKSTWICKDVEIPFARNVLHHKIFDEFCFEKAIISSKMNTNLRFLQTLRLSDDKAARLTS